VPKKEWQEFTNWTCCSPELCLVGYELMQLQPFERVGVMILSGKGNKKVEQPEVRKQREVLDDFVRNFCMTYGLMKTLEVFEVEWFEMKEKGRVIESQLILVPDEYGRSLQLTNILQRLQEQLEQQNVVARYSFLPTPNIIKPCSSFYLYL
jgi:hypothetical protein